MPDPDPDRKLDEIHETLREIGNKLGGRRAFWTGVLRGAGSIVGVAAVLILIGWLLNLAGFVPGLADQAEYLRGVIEEMRRKR